MERKISYLAIAIGLGLGLLNNSSFGMNTRQREINARRLLMKDLTKMTADEYQKWNNELNALVSKLPSTVQGNYQANIAQAIKKAGNKAGTKASPASPASAAANAQMDAELVAMAQSFINLLETRQADGTSPLEILGNQNLDAWKSKEYFKKAQDYLDSIKSELLAVIDNLDNSSFDQYIANLGNTALPNQQIIKAAFREKPQQFTHSVTLARIFQVTREHYNEYADKQKQASVNFAKSLAETIEALDYINNFLGFGSFAQKSNLALAEQVIQVASNPNQPPAPAPGHIVSANDMVQTLLAALATTAGGTNETVADRLATDFETLNPSNQVLADFAKIFNILSDNLGRMANDIRSAADKKLDSARADTFKDQTLAIVANESVETFLSDQYGNWNTTLANDPDRKTALKEFSAAFIKVVNALDDLYGALGQHGMPDLGGENQVVANKQAAEDIVQAQ